MHISRIHCLSLLLFSLLTTSVSVAASNKAQTIYRCKDKAGHIVFQQYACNENQINSKSPAYQLWRDLRMQSSLAKKILAGLGADVASIKQCQNEMNDFHQDLINFQPRVLAMARTHEELLQAWKLLQVCGECRTSAVSNCILADQQLQKTMAKLTEY